MEKLELKLTGNIDYISLCGIASDLLTFFITVKGVVVLDDEKYELDCDSSGKIQLLKSKIECSDNLLNILILESDRPEIADYLVEQYKKKYKIYFC